MDPYQSTDEELMHEFQQGNSDAMAVIFNRHKHKAFNFALRFLNNRADAEDAFSEAVALVCEKRMSYQPRAKFITWFYTIIRNVSIMKIRRNQQFLSLRVKNEKGDFEDMPLTDTQELTPQTMARHETVQQVQKAISELPLEQKEALILREYQELSYAEIAGVLNCSLEKVKILIYRARTQLQQTIPSLMKEGGIQ